MLCIRKGTLALPGRCANSEAWRSDGRVVPWRDGWGIAGSFSGIVFPLPIDPYDLEAVGIKHKLKQSVGLTNFSIRVIEEVEYLSTPEDVLIKKCFGQNEKLKAYVWSECLDQVERIFREHATDKGLRVINYHHLVIAKMG